MEGWHAVAKDVERPQTAEDAATVAPEFPSRWFPPVTYRDLHLRQFVVTPR